MDNAQFKKFMKELSDIKGLLVLNAWKSGASTNDIGKCLGVSKSMVKNIIYGVGKKKT